MSDRMHRCRFLSYLLGMPCARDPDNLAEDGPEDVFGAAAVDRLVGQELVDGVVPEVAVPKLGGRVAVEFQDGLVAGIDPEVAGGGTRLWHSRQTTRILSPEILVGVASATGGRSEAVSNLFGWTPPGQVAPGQQGRYSGPYWGSRARKR